MENSRFLNQLNRNKAFVDKLSGFVVKLFMAFLPVCFVLSSVASMKQSRNEKQVRAEVENIARQYLVGNKMVKRGVLSDCSAFTQTVFKRVNVELPRSAQEQFNIANKTTDQQKGNLLFFSYNGQSIGHVAISLGDSTFIHSPGVGKNVVIDSLAKEYYKKYFYAAGDVLSR